MIQTIITLVNVFILFIGVYSFVSKGTANNCKPVNAITSIIISLTVLSFLYYLMLAFKQNFTGLLTILSIINLLHFYFTKNALSGFFKNKVSEAFNFDNFWALCAAFLLTCYYFFHGSKYGGWDAWAMWNMHAKFLYHTDVWKHVFSSNLAYSSPDYPLMLPSIIAFFWTTFHSITPIVPELFSYALLICIPLLIYYSLIDRGLKLLAYLSLGILITDNNFKQIALSQEADCLLSLLILLVFIKYKNLNPTSASQIYLLGFICASCAWVKNEGLVFYLIFTIGFLIKNYKNKKLLKNYLAGITIPTIIIASYKLFFSSPNDLVVANHKSLSSLFTVLLSGNRYVTIIKFGADTLLSTYMWALILIVVGIIFNRKTFSSLPIIAILLLLSVYFMVYIFTPYNLTWHLSTSLYRLFQHVYPALIYLLLFSLKDVKAWTDTQKPTLT